MDENHLVNNKEKLHEMLDQWDFNDLIRDVKSTKDVNDKKLEVWKEAFKNFWETDKSKSWNKLVTLLPSPNIPADLAYRFKTNLLLEKKDVSISSIIFLVMIVGDKLFKYFWKDEFSSGAFQLIAGCINIINLSPQMTQNGNKLSIEGLKTGFSKLFLSYPLLMLALSIKYPEIFEKNGTSIKCLSVITLGYKEIMIGISSYNYEINNFVDFFSSKAGSSKELSEIVKDVFGNDKNQLCRLLNKVLSKDINIPYQEIIPIWLSRDKKFDWKNAYEELVLTALNKPKYLNDDALTAIIRHFPFESPKISKNFLIKAEISKTDNMEKDFFILWASYLVREHVYEFFWFSLNAKEDNSFGANLDERLDSIYHQIEKQKFRQVKESDNDFMGTYQYWKLWKTLFRPLGSLFEIHGSYRYGHEVEIKEEIWIRQSEALEILESHPELVAFAIKGILDYSRKYWDLLDPVIIGLPDEIVVDTLNKYLETNHSHEKHYHALRLLSHAKNRIPEKGAIYLTKNSGLLEAVEDLYEFSRTKLQRYAGLTWLGDAAVENLTFGAINKASNEFIDYFDSQYGQDEHEHVSVLIETLHRNFKRLSQVVSDWLKHNSSFPAVFQTSIKRFPKRTTEGYPQEGGERGTQADMAVILKCDIPELMLTERITFFQAKKVGLIPKTKKWESSISINQPQLRKALKISEHFYYLFFLHSEIGKCPVILPAQMIKDICMAHKMKKIPVPIILRAAREFPRFFLKDLIGLWVGDTRQGVIKKARKGCDIGQAPRIILEVSITKGNAEQNIQF